VSAPPLGVGIVGAGLIGHKRAAALRPQDRLLGATDVSGQAAATLVAAHGGEACADLAALLALEPDVVVVAVSHDALAPIAREALAAGAHVLIEKPAGRSRAEVETLIAAAAAAGRHVKVGFNHRFHPGIARAVAQVHSGEHGELMHLRARYGHGGRIGYDREWRTDPARSGAGELIDQGMHLLDLSHWLAGPLPVHSALLRTQFWDTAVEDNAALILGEADSTSAPWAMLHVSWTEWKNLFSLEIYCRRAKLTVDGLVRSYGPQTLRIYRMSPQLGPPELEEVAFEDIDHSWEAEWDHFARVIGGEGELLGDLADAHYAWCCVEGAYARNPAYAGMREGALR
jgi:predicted dehydrogenase